MAKSKVVKLKDTRLAAAAAAARLRDIILTRESGTLLGSESDVAELLGVGRATVRQTARLLEGEQLLYVRRGVGGGYYVSRPNIDTVVNAAVTYLSNKKADINEVFRTAAILLEEIACRACMSENQEEREKIKRIHDVMTSNDSIDHWGVGALEREFVDCLFRMADAPFTELMLRVNTKFYLDTGVHILTSEERIRSHKLGRAKIIEAILARDEELTLLYAKRSNRLGADWLAEEIAAQRRGEPSAKLL